MSRLNQCTIDEIVEVCIKNFNSLPKTGKPLENEWTVLSCIVQYDNSKRTSKTVSLGTGSKCIGGSQMSPLGNILNDSHAEVIARRGFLLYLYKHIDLCLQNKGSIFEFKNSKCQLKPNIEFLFYSSQLPCGDASIISKDDSNEQIGDVLSTGKRSAEGIIADCEEKKAKLDIFRTGAKCLETSIQDPKLPGVNYHILGQVRTKPGRGDRTLSVSCSDKIARWIHLGIQGSLLSLLVEPIFIKHFIFGAGVPYSKESLIRAFISREDKSEICNFNDMPYIYQSTIAFPYIKADDKTRPAPSGIIWVNLHNGITEVAVQGKRLGVTKKNTNCPKNYLSICKYNLYKQFQEILWKNDTWQEEICGNKNLKDLPYNEMKQKSIQYMTKWKEVKENFFHGWTRKPDIFNFKIL